MSKADAQRNRMGRLVRHAKHLRCSMSFVRSA